MASMQRSQNPDVNSYNPDTGPAENTDTNPNNTGSGDIERKKEDSVIPVPPDSRPAAPVEEPPESDGIPVGDVDDSPKRIV